MSISFLNPPDLRGTDWFIFHACLQGGLPHNSDLPNEVAIDACVKELFSAISKALESPFPSVAHEITNGSRYRLVFRMKYA
jgi:hypothetical protein